MKNYFNLILLLCSINCYSTELAQSILINMDSICKEFKEKFNDVPKQCLINMQLANNHGPGWIIKFQMGFSRAKYLPTTLYLKNEKLDIKVEQFRFEERTSAEYYNPKNWNKVTDAFKLIDEPTNTFTLVLENERNTFFIRLYHPKFLKEENYWIPEAKTDTKYHILGTVDNVAVDTDTRLDSNYDEYHNDEIPNINLIGLANTHKQVEVSIGYGRKVNLFELKKIGKVSINPEAGIGMFLGETRTTFRDEFNYGKDHVYIDSFRVHGLALSASNKIELSMKRISIYADIRYHHAKLKNSLDANGGEANYNQNIIVSTIGIGFNLATLKKNSAP